MGIVFWGTAHHGGEGGWQELEAAAHTVYTHRKKRRMRAGDELTSSLDWSPWDNATYSLGGSSTSVSLIRKLPHRKVCLLDDSRPCRSSLTITPHCSTTLKASVAQELMWEKGTRLQLVLHISSLYRMHPTLISLHEHL